MSRMTHTPRRAALLTGISIASLLLAGQAFAQDAAAAPQDDGAGALLAAASAWLVGRKAR